jgi:hypothetical protein
MTAQIIQIRDYQPKGSTRPENLQEMALAMTEQFNRMAEAGTEVVCERVPFEGAGIDGMFPKPA